MPLSCKVDGKPLATNQEESLANREAKQFFLPLYQPFQALPISNYPFSLRDFAAPSYYQQHNKFADNKGYIVPFKEQFDTYPRNKFSRKPIKQNEMYYNDREALELATAIVEKYVTMKKAGVEPANPIMDIYFKNGETLNVN